MQTNTGNTDDTVNRGCMSCGGCLLLLGTPFFLIAGQWYLPLIGLLLLAAAAAADRDPSKPSVGKSTGRARDPQEERWEQQAPRYDWWDHEVH